MIEFLSAVFAGALSAGVVAIITLGWRKTTSRRPFLRVLGMRAGESTVIILPHRPILSSDGKPIAGHLLHVTYQDMLGANYVERILTLAGTPDDKFELLSVHQFHQDGDHRNKNLILIGSSKANPITHEILSELNRRSRLVTVEFRQTQAQPERWVILYKDAEIHSPSYTQAVDLSDQSEDPEAGEVQDCALLLRMTNPWYSDRKVMIIAGIRGIGTWGQQGILEIMQRFWPSVVAVRISLVFLRSPIRAGRFSTTNK